MVIRYVKKTGFKLLGLVALVCILFIMQAQTEEQGWKKTITLSSGEVVCDLNGEWNLLAMILGGPNAAFIPPIRDVVKITQEGNSFKGIRMIGNSANPKGTVIIEGKLDKNGFKKLLFSSPGRGINKGKIGKDGNKIEFYQLGAFDIELTRK